MSTLKPLRILACSISQEYGNDYAFIRAFRRAGHSVKLVRPEIYAPPWKGKVLRLVYRLIKKWLDKEFNRQIIHQAIHLQPGLFFAFKGHLIFPETIQRLKEMGVVTVLFYPDVSFYNHGPYLPKTVAKYDWVFSTKPEHPEELLAQFDFPNASFMPHAFNPEIHKPVQLNTQDIERYACDVCFIGNYSKGKEALLLKLVNRRLDLHIKIWGGEAWRKAPRALVEKYGGIPLHGLEYAKALQCSKINLGLLLEKVKSAGRGDSITARTFEIPAANGFMLHERTDTVLQYFEEGKEIACFGDEDELVSKVDFYLAHDEKRKQMIAAAYERSQTSGYSIDNHMKHIIDKYEELNQKRS